MEIKITSKEIPEGELRSLILHSVAADAQSQFSIRDARVRVRGLDAAVVVALVGASSAAIGALLTGLLQIAKQRSSGTITLQGSDGSRIDVPANTTPDKIDELIGKLRTISGPQIHIGNP